MQYHEHEPTSSHHPTMLPAPVDDPITSEGERDTDPGEVMYSSDAPPPVPLDENERKMLAEWERGWANVWGV